MKQSDANAMYAGNSSFVYELSKEINENLKNIYLARELQNWI